VTRDPTLEAYYAEAASWEADRADMQRRSARTAWWVAGAGWICAITTAIALMLLTPLKSVEPFLIRVDRTTGVVDVVPVYTGHATLSETVTRYFLTHYVSICERFNFATAESDYKECGAFQTPKENAAWYERWNPANPHSPLNVHKDGSTVSVQVEAVSFFKRADGVTNLAQVRYLTIEREGSGAPAHDEHWIATVEYAYGHPSADPSVRLLNPLGFKVVSITREPEVLSGVGANQTLSVTGSGNSSAEVRTTVTAGQTP
jgi:type IV secretion system protein VirB8